jgi:hypothetical protein
VIAIQGAFDVAFHAHSRATTIEMVPVPPDGVNDAGVLVAVAWQRVVEGLVRLVAVELPQAVARRDARVADMNKSNRRR